MYFEIANCINKNDDFIDSKLVEYNFQKVPKTQQTSAVCVRQQNEK